MEHFLNDEHCLVNTNTIPIIAPEKLTMASVMYPHGVFLKAFKLFINNLSGVGCDLQMASYIFTPDTVLVSRGAVHTGMVRVRDELEVGVSMDEVEHGEAICSYVEDGGKKSHHKSCEKEL